MSALDDAKAEVARLERHAELEVALAAAGSAYEADPTPENLAAHDAAAVALAEHRATGRTSGGPTVSASVAPESGE